MYYGLSSGGSWESVAQTSLISVLHITECNLPIKRLCALTLQKVKQENNKKKCSVQFKLLRKFEQAACCEELILDKG